MKDYTKALRVVAVLFLMFVSCDRVLEMDYRPVDDSYERHYEIEVDHADKDYFDSSIKTMDAYPVFSLTLLEMGYRPVPSDAAYYKAIDDETGEMTRVTMIPCINPDQEDRIAIIYCIDDGESKMITSAEYYEYENYEVSHPIDQEVIQLALREGLLSDKMIQLEHAAATAGEYWKCVAKRFVAGCVGCVVKCYISGPAWGPCTTACCTGAVIVGMVSCYFQVAGV